MPLVYAELRRLADSYLRNESSGHTLQPTALVHEAYVRLAGQEQPDYESRAHFSGVAAQVMRQILVDHARRRNATKRGGGKRPLQLDDGIDAAEERAGDLIALDDALTALAQQDPKKAKLVELRYFGGLSAEEASEVMSMSVQTVYREIRIANAWLRRFMEEPAT